MRLNNETKRYGFYINIYSSGPDEDTAVSHAKTNIINRLQSKQEVVKDMLDSLVLVAEEVTSVDSSNDLEDVSQGFVWYVDDEASN